MILNTSIVKQGSESAVYSITDRALLDLLPSAKTGEIVYAGSRGVIDGGAIASDSTAIPMSLSGGKYYFVMPAQDVTVS